MSDGGNTVLTADLVNVRIRKGRIEIPEFAAAQSHALEETAALLIVSCEGQVGHSRSALLAEWDALCERAGHPKQVRGLRKLLLDRCSFEESSEIPPREIRKALFSAAAVHRFGLSDDESFTSAEVFAKVSEQLHIPAESIPGALYSDLKENHILKKFESLSADTLVRTLERSQRQAVLLRAIRVTVFLRSSSANEYRRFFQRLKFRRLLHAITTDEGGGYKIEIDGPFSLFQSLTKYGLQLALMLPILEEFQDWRLEAIVAWGKSKKRCEFHLSGNDSASQDSSESWIPEEVSRLQKQIADLDSNWLVQPAPDLLNLPGIGLCVPDLRFTHKASGQVLHLEVMGYWSRDAVWKRVELVQAGLPDQIIFAVGRRLRVSEAVLDEDLPSQIYVYKGVMSAREILRRLDAAVDNH